MYLLKSAFPCESRSWALVYKPGINLLTQRRVRSTSQQPVLYNSAFPPSMLEATWPHIPQDLSSHFPHREMSERGCSRQYLFRYLLLFLHQQNQSFSPTLICYLLQFQFGKLSICFIKVELMQVFFKWICTWV